jgi:hypothetical protein
VDWRDKYIAWMGRGELPSDRSEARRIARMAKSFALVDGELYKRAASGILQRCVPTPEGRELLRDIHAGICGHHAAPRTLVGNAFRQGFYWPTAVTDASEIVRTCEGCQFYARKSNLPAHVLQTIPITWPFAVWGLDIVGPLRKVPEGFTHLLVANRQIFQVGRGAPHYESQGRAGGDVFHGHRPSLWSAQFHHHRLLT